MKSIILIFIILFSTSLWASKKGIGISIGNPTGINAKQWIDNKAAVDGGMAWSIGRFSQFSLHSDYLLHNKDALYINDIYPLDFYYGVGGRMAFSNEIEIGVRIPAGLLYAVDGQQADVFSEIAPIVDLIGRTGLEVHLLLGARYYF